MVWLSLKKSYFCLFFKENNRSIFAGQPVQKINCQCHAGLLIWIPRGMLLFVYIAKEWFHMLMPSFHQCPTNGIITASCSLAWMHARISAEIQSSPLPPEKQLFKKEPKPPLSTATPGKLHYLCSKILFLIRFMSIWKSTLKRQNSSFHNYSYSSLIYKLL